MAVTQSLSLTQVSQSVSDNSSQVRLRWTSKQTGPSYNNYNITGYYWIAKNGGSETKYSKTTTLPANTTKTIADTTFKVAHRTDGTGSVRARTSINTELYDGVITKSAGLTLDTIPRATTPTLSSSSVSMGSSLTITLPRASTSFTHDLSYKYGSRSYTSIATGVSTSKTWTVPDLASSIPNATSLTVTIKCVTKKSGTVIGTKYVTLTAKVPTSVVPTIRAVTFSESVAGLDSQFGVFVQNKSKVRATISGEGIKGSSITAYDARLQDKTYTGSSWTSDVLKAAGTLPVKVRVRDSRGRWSDYSTYNLTVAAYAPPKIRDLKAYRCNADGTPNDEGTYGRIEYRYSVSPVGGRNTASVTLAQKRSTATGYSTLYTDTALSADTFFKTSSAVFSVDYSFDIKLTVKDWFNATQEALTELPSGATILDLKANGKGIAFGKTCEQDGIEFGWPIAGMLEDVPLSGLPTGSTYTCKFFPLLGVCFLRIYATGKAVPPNEWVTLAAVPEQYRPSAAHTLSIYAAQSGTLPHIVRLSSTGNIQIYTTGTKVESDDMYITGFWFVT